MEVALKERLVGAVVLVALGVWLIPLFLDGPEDDAAGTDSRPLTLPVPSTAKPDRTTKTIKLTNVRPSSRPASAAATAPAELPPPAPNVVVANPEPKPSQPKPAQLSTMPNSATTSASGWFVQLGSFGTEANAKRLAAEVSALGWDAQLSQINAAGKALHRVRVGPVPTRSKADALRAELVQRGFEAKVMNER